MTSHQCKKSMGRKLIPFFIGNLTFVTFVFAFRCGFNIGFHQIWNIRLIEDIILGAL